MHKTDVVAIGELLVDFTPCGIGEMGNPAFEMNPGGAPANCLAALNKLGAKTEFIGKVGTDSFGNFLETMLAKEGIGTSGLSRTSKTNTTLAFVHLAGNGERSFTFLRDPGADTQLMKEDIDYSLIDKSRILHFGSLSLTNNPSRETVLNAILYAKSKGILVSYDPNYRPLLWKDENTALYWMHEGLKYADIVKMSEEELILITESNDILEGAKVLRKVGAGEIFITLGSRGAFYYMDDQDYGYVPAYKCHAIDTTGCGDAFMGAILYQILYHKDVSARDMVRYGNVVGALCALKKGGMPAMPLKGEVDSILCN